MQTKISRHIFKQLQVKHSRIQQLKFRLNKDDITGLGKIMSPGILIRKKTEHFRTMSLVRYYLATVQTEYYIFSFLSGSRFSSCIITYLLKICRHKNKNEEN